LKTKIFSSTLANALAYFSAGVVDVKAEGSRAQGVYIVVTRLQKYFKGLFQSVKYIHRCAKMITAG
jgi:hypothetical protein